MKLFGWEIHPSWSAEKTLFMLTLIVSSALLARLIAGGHPRE